MTDGLRQDLDERIRRAFDPDPAATGRVVARAVAQSPRVSHGRRIAVAVGAGALCLAAVVALWMSPLPAERAPAIDALHASFVDGVFVVPLPDGSASITSSEARDDRPPDGYGIVLVEGELR